MPPATPQHWNLEPTGQQSEIFNRPPPPYPGPGAIRTPQRFYVTCPGDRQGQFPEGQLPRPQFVGNADSNAKQLGARWVNLHTTKTCKLYIKCNLFSKLCKNCNVVLLILGRL